MSMLQESVLKIVHAAGPERAYISGLPVSAARQPGQPRPGIQNLGQVEVGVLQQVY